MDRWRETHETQDGTRPAEFSTLENIYRKNLLKKATLPTFVVSVSVAFKIICNHKTRNYLP